MGFKRFAKSLLTAFVLLCAAVPFAYAQSASATINGTVHDSSGAIVADAEVAITNQATGARLET